MAQAAEHDIEFVDLVCVNLYPFERTVARAGRRRRGRHREHRHRRPDDDPRGGEEPRVRRRRDEPGVLRRGARGARRAPAGRSRRRPASRSPPRRSPTPRATTRRSPAGSPSAATTSRTSSPARTRRRWTCRTARTRTSAPRSTPRSARARGVLARVRQLHGKELSFNNLLDLDGARLVLAELSSDRPPGHRQAQQPVRRRRRRRRARRLPQGLRRRSRERVRRHHRAHTPVDGALARRSSQQFVEVLIAPGYDEEALALLAEKPNVRLLEDEERRRERNPDFDIRAGRRRAARPGPRRRRRRPRRSWRSSPQRQPTDAEWRDLRLRLEASAATCKSNAIVARQGAATLGIGAGQMSRVDSVEIADRAATGSRAATASSSPPTPSSRSATAPARRSTPASRRSSSPAARSATTRSSPPSTSAARRWCSRAAATSGTSGPDGSAGVGPGGDGDLHREHRAAADACGVEERSRPSARLERRADRRRAVEHAAPRRRAGR